MSKPGGDGAFGIASDTAEELVQAVPGEGGAQALKPKPKGRPKGIGAGGGPTREEELEERVRKLEAQVAYLKIDCPEAEALPNRDKALVVAELSGRGTCGVRSPGGGRPSGCTSY